MDLLKGEYSVLYKAEKDKIDKTKWLITKTFLNIKNEVISKKEWNFWAHHDTNTAKSIIDNIQLQEQLIEERLI